MNCVHLINDTHSFSILLHRCCGGCIISVQLLQSPASSDCAFIRVGCSVSSRYTFPKRAWLGIFCVYTLERLVIFRFGDKYLCTAIGTFEGYAVTVRNFYYSTNIFIKFVRISPNASIFLWFGYCPFKRFLARTLFDVFKMNHFYSPCFDKHSILRRHYSVL